jgi:hypothetical protein
MPMPEPSAITMKETAIAVMAPAITALHDIPFQAPPQPPEGEPTTATLSPTIVVSSICCLPEKAVHAYNGNFQRTQFCGFCHPIAAFAL